MKLKIVPLSILLKKPLTMILKLTVSTITVLLLFLLGCLNPAGGGPTSTNATGFSASVCLAACFTPHQ